MHAAIASLWLYLPFFADETLAYYFASLRSAVPRDTAVLCRHLLDAALDSKVSG